MFSLPQVSALLLLLLLTPSQSAPQAPLSRTLCASSTACPSSQRCISGECTPAGGVAAACNDPSSVCQPGLSCVGNPGNKRCFMRKGLGMACGKDPFWVCRDGLRCLSSVCVAAAAVATSCNDPAVVCQEGLSCVGNEGNKRCFMKKGKGMACGKDPFWVCRSGLVCKDRVCQSVVGQAGSCNQPGTICGEGLRCVGNEGNKRCFMKKGPGMACGKDPFWVCRAGLACKNGLCVPVIEQAGSCNEPGDMCREGLSCVGNEGNKRCFMKKGPGMACGKDPFWVCRAGLACKNGLCVPAIEQAGSCNEPGDICRDGLSCVGNVGNKRCFMKKGPGMACGKDPFWVCRSGLRCVDGKCVRAIGTGGSCNEPGIVCQEGLSCVGNAGNKRCFRKRVVGEKCGMDPFWQCRGALRCVGGMCRV